MFTIYNTLYQADKNGIEATDFYVTGSVIDTRPPKSIKTPADIAQKMITTFLDHHEEDVIYEPCAGQGGILEQLATFGMPEGKVFFNEINTALRASLRNKFDGRFQLASSYDSLEPFAFKGKHATKVIMNPPFDNPAGFLERAINLWTTDYAEIVTLFPKYALSRLNTYSRMYCSILTARKFTVEELPSFECGYGAKVALIHIVK